MNCTGLLLVKIKITLVAITALPPLLTSKPEKVGKKVYNAYVSKLDIVYISGIWKYIMLIIKCVPEFIFKRIKL